MGRVMVNRSIALPFPPAVAGVVLSLIPVLASSAQAPEDPLWVL